VIGTKGGLEVNGFSNIIMLEINHQSYKQVTLSKAYALLGV
jgi:hypothetical protein